MKLKTYTHLSPEERDKIAILRAQGVSSNGIAMELHRDKGTISRELRRNKSAIYDSYYPHPAHYRSAKRKSEAHQRPRLKNNIIRRYMLTHLKQGWSPEQIAGEMSKQHPGYSISYEAIYQYLYDPVLRREENLVPYLVRAHKKRHIKGHRHTHKSSHIPARISILQRPGSVQQRRQLGHWETDAVISRQSTAALNVTVERKSRLTRITKMNHKTARNTHRALTKVLSVYPKHVRRTITYDNGSENVEHQRTNARLGTKSYFCQPFHSWEKATVENTIGLVRRVFPKKTNFDTISHYDVKKLERLLNNRPRKCLSFQTPLEVFNKCVALKH
jgi:IS30 family transposase